MKKSFEDIIKSKSKGYEKEAPPEVWGHVREHLRGTGKINWAAIILSAAAIIVAIVLAIVPPESKNAGEVTKANQDSILKVSTKKHIADSFIALNKKTPDPIENSTNPISQTDNKKITLPGTSAPEYKDSRLRSKPEKTTPKKVVYEKINVPKAENFVAPAERPTEIAQTNSSVSEDKDTDKKQEAPAIPEEKTAQAEAAKTPDSSAQLTTSPKENKEETKVDGDKREDKKGKGGGDPDAKQPGRFGFEIQAGYTMSLGHGMDYKGPDNSNGFRWVPLADNFDPASAAFMDYESHRNNTDRNVKLPHYGLLVHYQLSRLFTLSSGITYLSIGRQIAGDYTVYHGSYSSSTEGDIKVDSNTMFPLIEPDGQNYYTPFGSNYVLQQYSYISIPLQVHFQAFSFRDFSFKAHMGMEYNLYRNSTSLYYFDYNNYRYFKLSNAEQRKYIKAQMFSFSPGLSLQYRLGNFHVSSYAQYSFIPGSIYTNNSYIQEYYKAFRYGLGFGYTLNARNSKRQDRLMN